MAVTNAIEEETGCMFACALGIFITAISVVRFAFAFQLQNDGDLSWDDLQSFTRTSVQMCFGVAATRFPAMVSCGKGLIQWNQV